MFAFGAASLIMALFFAELDFTDVQIGLFMTLTLVGDVALSFVMSLMADGLGRRRVLLAGGLLMAMSGVVFALFENFWVLLLAAVIGVISASGGDFGPFRAIEESTLSHLTNPKTRSDVLSWYVTVSSLGSAAGTEMSGRVVETLRNLDGWDILSAYHALFWVYVVMGLLNVLLAASMSSKCELNDPKPEGEGEATGESAQGLLDPSQRDDDDDDDGNTPVPKPTPQTQSKKSRFSQISAATRSVMYKLWFLLTVDSLADGMVSYTLTNYYLDRKFHLSKSRLGDIMSICYILGAISTIFAGPLARHLGLVNTMVFTHVPSSLAVLLFPAPSGLVLTIVLLFIRTGLNNMDQAPRTAFIAAVVKPEERTAVMGITSTLRTMASTIGPTLTGALAHTNKFWVAFVMGGALRLAYDFGLWAMFINMKLYEHEEGGDEQTDARRRESDEESFELEPVGHPQDRDDEQR
jgi:MFS family permease